MNSRVRKFLAFLGLVEDEYGDYPSAPARPYPEPVEYAEEPEWSAAPAPSRPYARTPQAGMGTRPMAPSRRPSSISVIDGGEPPRVRPVPGTRLQPQSVVSRPSAAGSPRPMIVMPRSYNESRQVADPLREGHFVVLNVRRLEPDTYRRVIDFAAGVVYILDAHIERLDHGVFLISPKGRRMSHELRDSLQASNYQSFDLA